MMSAPQDTTGVKPLPQYRAHKTVWALCIAKVEPYAEGAGSGTTRLSFSDEGYAPRDVSNSVLQRYTPVPGDYFVVYGDGYQSISPRKAFIDGYSLVDPASSYAAVELAVKRPPITFEYRGFSYEQASRQAQAICRAAGVTGQTINAAKHLAELHAVMDLTKGAQD